MLHEPHGFYQDAIQVTSQEWLSVTSVTSAVDTGHGVTQKSKVTQRSGTGHGVRGHWSDWMDGANKDALSGRVCCHFTLIFYDRGDTDVTH